MKIHYHKIIVLYICSNILILFGQHLQNIGLEEKDKVLRLPEAFIIETQIKEII